MHEIINSLSEDDCITVFFIDLDKFKMVNDQYGHDVGDQLLLEAAKRLQACFRENDFVARLGGDEFTAIVPHAPNKKNPETIAQHIIQNFEPLLKLGNNISIKCSVSIGFAIYPQDAQTPDDLIIKADLAMYHAKKIKGSAYYKASNVSLK